MSLSFDEENKIKGKTTQVVYVGNKQNQKKQKLFSSYINSRLDL